jgi:hypothetical protein
MSAQIETHYIQTFKGNLELISQQKQSMLEQLVTTQPCEGEACQVKDLLGTVTAKEKTLRHEDTKYSDTERFRRWLMPREFYTAELYDKSDLIRMLTDPQSALIQTHVAAMNRKKDGVILESFFAAAATGEKATSGTTAYDTGNDIASTIEDGSTPAGLTIKKLIRAKADMMRRFVDVNAEVPTAVINTKAWEDLFGQTNFISSDYQNNKPLQSAPTQIFQGGANLSSMEHADFPVNGTTEYYLPYFVRSGIVLGIWSAREISVAPVPGKVSSWEVKVIERFAATRVDEKKVARIKIKYAA